MPSPQKQNIRGVKRKRPDDNESEEDIEAKLRRKLHRALRELRKVVKKARTFEVQKTLKKLKDARRRDPENEATKDLEAQMEILKRLNYDQIVRSALVSKLKKEKVFFADPSIRVISAELASNLVASPGVPGTPPAKVQSRIMSSKILASEVASIMGTLRMVLRPSERKEDIAEAADKVHPSQNVAKKRRIRSEVMYPSKDSLVVYRSGEESDGYASGDDAIAQGDDGWESGTVGVSSETNGSVAESSADRSSDSGQSDDPMSGQDRSEEAEFLSEAPRNMISPSHRSNGQSEFLPSLSVGFTRGDSGSEYSDSEAKLADGIKKNRRGQRARRAIWEKKFGKNANHMKGSQQVTTRGTRSRSDPVSIDRRSGSGNSSLRPHRTPLQSREPVYGHELGRKATLGAPGDVKNLGSTKGQVGRIRRHRNLLGKQGEPPLHPSWEAKRKQKAASIIPSQGTKIVFSES